MKTEITQKLKWGRRVAILTMIIGTILLIYMIKVEDEPGALPLFLIITGILLLIVNNYQTKKRLKAS